MSKTRDIAILELFERARAALPLRQFVQELRADLCEAAPALASCAGFAVQAGSEAGAVR